ncbi:hypothetical protein [Lactonifactor longoviformis]|uniref:Uncharacterized protein n=1 Tax=Lactonifactor longoviformis DSM 17459 TaxID=1122155 RepID=A0A1M4XLV0_9CLOT|nr:hypothetical protein [Lactonifactor longoviformis]SHE94449.1 hypothetical protein SAMN02745158_02024 [Lactonifactor longoviformis DSM 17459]
MNEAVLRDELKKLQQENSMLKESIIVLKKIITVKNRTINRMLDRYILQQK